MSEPRKTLFSNAAAYYARYRSSYPPQLFEALAKRLQLDGNGRLLDLGCGPGNVALGLAGYFSEVLAVDINLQMLAEGQRLAQVQGVSNIVWLEHNAETLAPDLGPFNVIALGRSFHWMDRQKVLQAVWPLLPSGAALAVLAHSGQRTWWEQVAWGIAQRWRQAPREAEPIAAARHQDTLAQSGLVGLTLIEVPETQVLNPQQILGEMHSMSGGKPELFGDNLESFRQQLTQALSFLEPNQRFERQRVWQCWVAYKP